MDSVRFLPGEAQVGVIGLGYVGLPLAVAIARAGFSVTGVDTDPSKVALLQNGESCIEDVDAGELRGLVASSRFRASAAYSDLEACDVISICVPTPLSKTRDPDSRHILQAVEALALQLRRGMLLILESTTYPGLTETTVAPILARSGLRAGRDFFLCYSPERVDPANPDFGPRNIPKVIGGVTEACLRAGQGFYAQIVDQVVPVSSTRAAEMVKLVENTFRMVNIGLANEMAMQCERMGLDVWEVVEAAATKPFGYMPFHPGPGLGGHCIPVDPQFLAWSARQFGCEPRFIELAAEVNGSMPRYVVQRIQAMLNDQGRAVKGSRIHLVGVAYKRNVSDIRESPALDVATLLLRMQAEVTYSDRYVPSLPLGAVSLERREFPEAALASDIAVILADHDGVDYERLLIDGPLILDTRNALRGRRHDRLVRL